MGTVLAIGTAVATIGTSDSAAGAVSSTFNALRATIVVFSDHSPGPRADLVESAERPLDRLNGVASAGLVWSLGGLSGQLFQVSRIAPEAGAAPTELPVTAASAAGLATVGATVSVGRLYDAGMDHRGDLVALLGSAAASRLGISGVGEFPVIYIDRRAFTVIGIVNRAPVDPQALLGVIVPPSTAADIVGRANTNVARQIIVRTVPGAAQLIGRQGPYVIDPLEPGRIVASVPVDPSRLRESVSASLTSLLLVIAIIAFAVGVIAIANMSLLSVVQRRPEIGLRRSVGAAPRHIAASVVSDAGVTGAIGGIAGTSIGVLVTSAICAGRGWAPVLDPRLLVAAPVAGIAAGTLAGLYPAWRASLVPPLRALQR